MKSIDKFDNNTLIILHKNNLLKPLIKGELIKEILSEVSIKEELKNKKIEELKQNLNLSDEKAYSQWLKDSCYSEKDFGEIAQSKEKIKEYCKQEFNHKVGGRFLEIKDKLDTVVYSLIRCKDLFKARELYQRLVEKEDSFGNLAANFSEGPEKKTRGIVGPAPLAAAHPQLSEILGKSRVGKVESPIEINGSYVIVRLEFYEPAKLDEFMTEKLEEELFQTWIDSKVNEINLNILEKLNKVNGVIS